MQALKQASATPVINFACPTTQTGLTALIARLNAAVADVEKWCTIEERLGAEYRKACPKMQVLGGRAPGSRIVVEGREDVATEPYDWFYSSRSQIERGRTEALERAKTDEERQTVSDRYAALLAEWKALEVASEKAKPRGYGQAQRMLSKAHTAWTAAEQAIVGYQPKTLAEVNELLSFAGMTGKRVFFTPDDGDLKTVMQNAAAALATLLAH